MFPSPVTYRRWLVRAAPLLLAVAALPLLAPTCGTNTTGPKAFSKGSIIIPMDACYQGNAAIAPSTNLCPNPASRRNGNVIKAYGLVYQLARAGVPVYWIIEPTKDQFEDVDLTVQLAGGPVGEYAWTDGGVGAMPPNNTSEVIHYKGGPFVIDGSDFAAASQVLQTWKTTFSAVNVHVSKVAFTGYVAKSMTVGWDAGGTKPPPIALLNIQGADGQNAVAVVQQYLIDAGLGGTIGAYPAEGTAAGPHGAIYDTLGAADFCGGATSRLVQNGYKVLWAPHWAGGTTNPAGCTLNEIRTAIADFVARGNDYFSECASIATVEGAREHCASGQTHIDNTFPATVGRIATTGGVAMNVSGYDFDKNPASSCADSTGRAFYSQFIPLRYTSYPSPFMQIADFPFSVDSGFTANYQPIQSTSAWRAGVEHFITSSPQVTTNPSWDVFTVKPPAGGSGTTVYLAGHNYSSTGENQIAGSRLVLNTLFNLGSDCIETLAACSTGQLGACAAGKMRCTGSPEVPTCVPDVVAGAVPEACNGLDDDCDGAVDEDLTKPVYTGPAGTKDVGLCHAGIDACVHPGGAQVGTTVPLTRVADEVLPEPEKCNGLDDDCDGAVDEQVPAQACYSSSEGCARQPDGTYQCSGACRAGVRQCVNGAFGACEGQRLPGYESCEPLVDGNCNGTLGDGCGCVPGTQRPCYAGPAGTLGVGECAAGQQTCAGDGTWGLCTGDVRPAAPTCPNPARLDADCNGQPDPCPECTAPRACFGGVSGCTANGDGTYTCQGVCAAGEEACTSGEWAGACGGEIRPGAEICDAHDNDCDGTVDEEAPCSSGRACLNGACVTAFCNAEVTCREGFRCDEASGAGTGTCVVTGCGTGGPCPAGQLCRQGACTDPCAGVSCGRGAFCSGGECVGGGCFATGCAAGQLCIDGTCVADGCVGLSCPAGTFCRLGDCIQSCAFASCAVGERCGPDGFCLADPCATVTCSAGQLCRDGQCIVDPCTGVTCGDRQVCLDGACDEDPCLGVTCAGGQCIRGQCFSSRNPTGVGVPPEVPPEVEAQGTGCGCGSGDPTTAGALLALLLAAAPRRRRGGRPALLAALLAGGIVLGGCGPKEKEPVQQQPLDCVACGSACVDLQFDDDHCGACGHACGAGNACVDGVCGPTSPVAPHATALSPDRASRGGAGLTTVRVAGERFAEGAVLRFSGPSSQEVPAQLENATTLVAQVDLRDTPTGTLEVRVLVPGGSAPNAGRVRSNALPFEVVVESPWIDAVTPAECTAGQQLAGGKVTIAGRGFLLSSKCHVSGPGVDDLGVGETRHLGATAVECDLDPSLYLPGVYQVTVQNQGLLTSNAVPFTVHAATPALTLLDPASGKPNYTQNAFAIAGSGFDPGARAQLVVAGVARDLPTMFIAPSKLYVAPVDLTGVGPGDHAVQVTSGGVTSNTLTYTVSAFQPELTAVSPASARQNASVVLRAAGASFDSSSRIEVKPPGGAFAQVGTTFVSAAAVETTLPVALPTEGTWLVQVRSAGGVSGTAAVDVLSDVAALADVVDVATSKRSVEQGATGTTTVTLRATGSNLEATANLYLSGPGAGPPDRELSSPVVTLAGQHQITATLPPTALEPGTYRVWAKNSALSARSNELFFAVTPGAPQLTSIAPTSVAQSATPLPGPVVLTGVNFVDADASGNGGSTVHVWFEVKPGDVTTRTYLDVPNCRSAPGLATCAAFVSPSRIDVTFDTTTAIVSCPGGATAYHVKVRNPNPGGAGPRETVERTFTLTKTCP